MGCMTMFSDILQKIVEKCPATVMVRGLLVRLLNPQALDCVFHAHSATHSTSIRPLIPR